MQDSAIRTLGEAAAPAFVNGDASHQAPGDEPAKPKPAARRAPPKVAPASVAAAVDAATLPFADGLGELLRLQDKWRERIAVMAHEQLSFGTTTGRELLAAGEAMAAEPELGRRLELFWAQALHQLERSFEHSTRLVQVLGGVGEPGAAGPRRRAG